MTDNTFKALILAGVLLQLTAVGLGFTSLGWRTPLIAAAAALALGAVGVWLGTGADPHPLGVGTALWAAVVLALGAWHGLSDGRLAAWSFRVAFVL